MIHKIHKKKENFKALMNRNTIKFYKMYKSIKNYDPLLIERFLILGGYFRLWNIEVNL